MKITFKERYTSLHMSLLVYLTNKLYPARSIDFEDYKYSISGVEDTKFRIISLTHTPSGYTVRSVLPNHMFSRFSAVQAFGGGSISRSTNSFYDILKKLAENSSKAAQKLAEFVNSYGHASIAEMPNLPLYFENVPDSIAVQFFKEFTFGGGQHTSSRYVGITNFVPKSIEKAQGNYYYENNSNVYGALNFEFEAIQKELIHLYRVFEPEVLSRLEKVFEIDITNGKQKAALKARTLDVVRYFLPASFDTSFTWTTNLRSIGAFISSWKSSNDQRKQLIAQMCEILLAPPEEVIEKLQFTPEAEELLRYTQSDETVGNSIENFHAVIKDIGEPLAPIQSFTSSPLEVELHQNLDPIVVMFAQRLQSLYPGLTLNQAYDFIDRLDTESKNKLSEVMFSGFNCYSQMPNTNSHSMIFECTVSLATLRDFVRNRFDRYSPYLDVVANYEEVLLRGFSIPEQLQHPELADFKELYIEKMSQVFERIRVFVQECKNTKNEKYIRAILEIMPLGTAVPYYNSSPANRLLYFFDRRERPGGDLSYRLVAWDMAKAYSEISPLLSGVKLVYDMRGIPKNISEEERAFRLARLGQERTKPSCTSREEFLDRS
jgi:thymidylate synthase ThyX